MGNKQTIEISKVEKKKYTDEQQQLFDRFTNNPFIVFDKDDKKIKVVIPLKYGCTHVYPIVNEYVLVKSFDVDVIGDEVFFLTLKEAVEIAERGKENLKQLFLS
jgi:hypothetical protein